MKVYEYGSEHEKTVAMFQCAAEPGWVFIPSAEALAKDYHVFLFVADGHDELYHQGLPADGAEGIQGAGTCGAGTDVPGALPGRSHAGYKGMIL